MARPCGLGWGAGACLLCVSTLQGAGFAMSVSQDRCDSALVEFPAGK